MTTPPLDINNVSQAIQLALGPVFLLTGIASLFLEVMLSAPLKWLVGLLFTGATLALVAGLALFLREVQLATRAIRIQAAGPSR